MSKENNDLWEEVVSEMYLYMEIAVNKENSYPYETVPPLRQSFWKFTNRYNQENGIRIIPRVNQYGIDSFYEIKLGPIQDKVIQYDEPVDHDEKTFNTFVKISADEIVGKHPEINCYRFEPLQDDPRRARLYSIALTKYLNKNEWEVFKNEKETLKNTIWIRRKLSGTIL